MTYLLDTSALLCHYRNQNGTKQIQSIFEDDTADILITSITLTEFARRLHTLGANTHETSEIINAYRALFTNIIAIDEAIALAATTIYLDSPQRIPIVDSLIAGAAKVNNAILVHHDNHMSMIPPFLLAQHDLSQS